MAVAPPVDAADCTLKACIDVYTQDGHIVIEGRKGSGPKSTKAVPAPVKSSTPRPKATKKVLNRPEMERPSLSQSRKV